MLVLSGNQLEYLKSKARYALSQVETHKGQEEDWRIDAILRELHDVCGMGYSMATSEVQSTPWEVIMIHLFRDTGRGFRVPETSAVDARLAEGWEIESVCGAGDYLLMRRRKAVRDIEAKSEPE